MLEVVVVDFVLVGGDGGTVDVVVLEMVVVM